MIALIGPARQRQYLMTRKGRGEVDLAGARKNPLARDRILRAGDVTGKGHITRPVGQEDFVLLVVHPADQSR